MKSHNMKSRSVAAWLLALLLILGLLSGCQGSKTDFHLPSLPANGCVLDVAGVLGESTKSRIQTENDTLQQADAKVYVVALDVLGGHDAADYAAGLFDRWNLGQRDLLILLSVSEQEYYLLQGDDVGADLTDDLLWDYAWNYMEHDFAAGDYDAGVRKVFDALAQWYETYYELAPVPEEDAEPASSKDGMPVWLMIPLAVVVAAAVAFLVLKLRGGNRRQGRSRRRSSPFGGNRYQGSRRRR